MFLYSHKVMNELSSLIATGFMKLDEGCTIVSKKDAENLGQKIQIWELACRKNIRVEGIAQGEEVE